MKAKFLRAVPILSLLVCLICLWQVAALKKQVTQLQTNLSSQISRVENETDCLRAMRRLLSCPGEACGDVNGRYSRVFLVDKGEVHWR